MTEYVSGIPVVSANNALTPQLMDTSTNVYSATVSPPCFGPGWGNDVVSLKHRPRLSSLLLLLLHEIQVRPLQVQTVLKPN